MSHRPMKAQHLTQAASPPACFQMYQTTLRHRQCPIATLGPACAFTPSYFPVDTSAGHLFPVTVHLCQANVFPRGRVGLAQSHVGPADGWVCDLCVVMETISKSPLNSRGDREGMVQTENIEKQGFKCRKEKEGKVASRSSSATDKLCDFSHSEMTAMALSLPEGRSWISGYLEVVFTKTCDYDMNPVCL